MTQRGSGGLGTVSRGDGDAGCWVRGRAEGLRGVRQKPEGDESTQHWVLQGGEHEWAPRHGALPCSCSKAALREQWHSRADKPRALGTSPSLLNALSPLPP